ncbi:LacI family DNA-binding transcriptional regulator [Lacticaseibacillus jixianensis]|uniref:LacI family DNA-binding transcriptional regulator n=1 Tax=Lacticaseibacillus jixianensis TaxID=2486012 RepID=A0ABW4B839_9LACO|nr:LacI family DNA-binding transcriptional regulator [Lacticaseibacillus jixianensis]
MTTIYDLARVTGISKSTVSRVVSGQGYVSAAKRQRILAAMRELHYIPNQRAKNLRRQRTNTIGFLLREYFPLAGEFMDVFVHEAARYGFTVNVYFTQNAETERQTLDLLASGALDAVFILTRINDWDVISRYTQFGPIATWQRVDRPDIYSNYLDHYPLYLKILEQLYREGHRQIGHVLSDRSSANTQARLRAIATFQARHPDAAMTFVCHFATQQNAGKTAAKRWLAAAARPHAVVFFADYVAAEFVATLRRAGGACPPDCTVVSTDNSAIAKLTAIRTMDLGFRSQACNGVRYLVGQLTDQELAAETIRPHWVKA